MVRGNQSDLHGRFTEVELTERTLPREWNDYFTPTAVPAWWVVEFNMSSVSQAPSAFPDGCRVEQIRSGT